MRLPSHAAIAALRRRACVILTAAASLSVTVPCGDAFDERLQWLLSLSDSASAEPLLRVEEIGPADGRAPKSLGNRHFGERVERAMKHANP